MECEIIVVSWKFMLTLLCPASLVFQAMSACWRWSWEQTTTHHGQMSLTVSNWEETLRRNCKKGVFDVYIVTLCLCPAEIELSCLIESISTTNPRIEWKKITNEGPSYVYFEKKISGNTSNPQVFHCVSVTLDLSYFLFQQVTWRTELLSENPPRYW